MYGFCWGGKQAVKATKYVGAAAIVHPAFIELSDVDEIVAPFCLIDSEDEPKETMDKFFEAVQKKPFGDKCFRRRYEIFHGFCAGRANYGDEKNAKEAKAVCPSYNSTNDRLTPIYASSSRRIWNNFSDKE